MVWASPWKLLKHAVDREWRTLEMSPTAGGVEKFRGDDVMYPKL